MQRVQVARAQACLAVAEVVAPLSDKDIIKAQGVELCGFRVECHTPVTQGPCIMESNVAYVFHL
jgi:hypothetical protein